ncbi:GAF domain-containing protein [Sphingomonas sp. AP4-R1]|uniref:GAF domain-containing protein n=1 Tax=Sphingomonas sp. AP4-R1 TaxID=2735134 RepID=UPI001493D5A9|nr:GAF domain-containing protein [Sphingomonas sp. AP4-R1]QJU56801.1 GAF domain-containing protein [Sphingomonas sp. AP4-R1]
MSKAAHASEDQRLAALADANILDTPAEQRFDDIVAMVAAICDTPIALVSLVDRDRQWFKAKCGVDVDETPIETSVCALAIRQDDLFVIPDLATDPRTRDFSLVTDPPHIRFYAGFPLVGRGGHAFGSLCAIDTAPRPGGLTERQALALEALARQTALEIERGAGARRSAADPSSARSIGVWDWDVPNDRVVADVGAATLFGVDPERAAKGAPIAEYFDGIHPDDVEQTRLGVQAAMTTGDPFTIEYRLRGPDGNWRWMLAQGRCEMAADGTPLRFPGISFDIHARKTAELRMAALLQLGDRLSASGDAAELAHAASEILGRTLGSIRVGYGLIDPVAETISSERQWCAPGIGPYPPTLHFRDYGSFIDDLKAGETVAITNVDVDPRTRDLAEMAKALDVHALVNLPLIEHGKFVALLFVNQDRPRDWTPEEIAFIREVAERTRAAVERRRVEWALEALNASLEEQVSARTRELIVVEESLRQSQKMEAVGQLTGGLAHDFNNLLTGISGAIEMMQVRIAQGRLGELDRYVSAAQGAARRAAALTHRLLAFSRRQTLDPKPVDVNRLVSGIEDLVRRTVGPDLHVEVVGAAGLWPAMVDPNQLENAILNLCINARDAMPNGGRITIETANKWLDQRAARERDLEPGQYLSLCVTDTGTGMTPEVQARAFDPFYTTKPIGEGTGLGLSMIYGFARQSGGQVRIYTEVEMGTTVCIYLPRHHGEAGPDEEGAQTSLEAQTRDPDSRTVLIVDDEPTVRMLVMEVLGEMGHSALEAGDGASALRVLQSGARVDLLITDVGLPGMMNGRQVADGALALLPDLRVLFITGYAENAVIGNRQLDPNMALLTKPFAMDSLAAKVREMLA